MDLDTYNSIIKFINDNPRLTRSQCFKSVKTLVKASSLNEQTFTSIYGQHTRRIFKSKLWQKAKESTQNLYLKYRDQCSSIAQLAIEYTIPPFLMAKLVLEGYQREEKCIEQLVNEELLNEFKTPAKLINTLLKESHLIDDERLSNEIFTASILDDDFGSSVDIIRNSIGLEYEVKLERLLQENNVQYQRESELRAKGFDKTPDFKLELPIYVNGKIVNWIESKASFGDMISHGQNYEDQFKCYVNRFGPGLVIYWFGYLNVHADRNAEPSILLSDHFPTNFISFDY